MGEPVFSGDSACLFLHFCISGFPAFWKLIRLWVFLLACNPLFTICKGQNSAFRFDFRDCSSPTRTLAALSQPRAEGAWTCSRCKRDFEPEKALQRHYKNTHPVPTSPSSSEGAIPVEIILVCFEYRSLGKGYSGKQVFWYVYMLDSWMSRVGWNETRLAKVQKGCLLVWIKETCVGLVG